MMSGIFLGLLPWAIRSYSTFFLLYYLYYYLPFYFFLFNTASKTLKTRFFHKELDSK